MTASGGKTICMISCLHPLQDDRIYWKEAVSLKKSGYIVIHLGVSESSFDTITNEGIRLLSISRKVYFKNPFIDKIFRSLTFRESIYKKLLVIATNLKADVYHFHDLQLNRIGPKLKKLDHCPKIVYDVHEPYPITVANTDAKNLFTRLIWKLYGGYIEHWEVNKSKYYDLIISTEENVYSRFINKLPDVPCVIIYNFSDLVQPQETTNEFDFIYCGGIRRKRGVFEILKAIKVLKKKKTGSKTLFIGTIHDKGLQEEINAFIISNGLQENVYIKEFVPYNEVIQYYSKSRIGLAIFKRNKVNETIMPIKIFEYIVLGIPVITSDFGHLKRITEWNQSGITVEPGNVEQLSKHMENLITNKSLYAKLKENCLNAADNYKWQLMEEKLADTYNNLLYTK